MMLISRTFLISVLLAVFSVPLFAGHDREKAYIEWKPLEGTLSYTIEIVDVFEDLVLVKTTVDTKLEVSLPYGKYRYRIGMLTKFNKISGWSDWKTLMIVPALEPAILSAIPAGLPAGVGTTVTIRGKNFYRSSDVIVKSGDAQLEVKNVRMIDPQTLTATIYTGNAKPGSRYDLVLRTPGDLLDLDAVAAKQFVILEELEGQSIGYSPGFEFVYYTPSLGVNDAYSGSLGVKIFYEFHSLGKTIPSLSFMNNAPGLYPGVLLSVSGFMMPKPGFGSSSMLEAGFYFGYDFSFPLKGELRWHISPVIGFKEYFRWHTYKADNTWGVGDDFFGSRPIVFAGCHLDFDLPRKFYIGIGLEYNAVFEVQPLNVLGVSVRCGYRL